MNPAATNQDSQTQRCIAEAERYGATNYAPIPVVLERGEGVYLYDVEGKRYMDMLSAYSAVNQGHQHPKIVAALIAQAKTLALTSRAFHNDKLGPFLKKACELTGMDRALPMNTGAEAVETGIKLARRWAYQIKEVPADKAEIIVCEHNFHGRTTTIVGFSSDEGSTEGFGPFTPGFRKIPYGDAAALEGAITDNTAAFLVEPIQGEAGVVLPPPGFLKAAREICSRHKVLLIADEVQTGLCRTGTVLRCEAEEVTPDVLLLGKALSGGLYPISLVLAKADVMAVFSPGSHGSTYGGNPLAAAVGAAALDVLVEEKLAERARTMGERFMAALRKGLAGKPQIKEVRGAGLLIAVEMNHKEAKRLVKTLASRGILAKDTHHTTIRFAPALVINEEQVDEAAAIIVDVLGE